MGKTIEKIAIDRGHKIALVVDQGDQHLFDTIQPGQVDVAIEFSQPDAAVNNILRCFELGIPIVSGTTGWLDHLPEIEKSANKNNGTLFYASNYSLGVNVFFKLNQILAEMMKPYKDYSIAMEEIHHTEKKDAPSGTAITLAEGIMDKNPDKTGWVNETTKEEEKIGIVSKRKNNVPGIHTIVYSSTVDEIEIKHKAYSRMGFAMGAVLVSEWLPGKKGILGMDDFLNI